MRKNTIITLALITTITMLGTTACGTPEETVIEKSPATNPITGNSDTGEYIYGGDPSVLVDGDTVYLYTGHDASTDEQVANTIYEIPEYLCYSSTDLINWKPEGTVMTMDTVEWAKDDVSAWASQVTRYQDQYYLYYCSWDQTGKQSIGVAVSDQPTGAFVDIGEPLVRGSVTKPNVSSFTDIDPTVWVETDENGEEHRYLAWGNGIFYICELNEDMISVKDVNGDGKITSGGSFEQADIVFQQNGIENYTEAPWLYRRQDENGNYYGEYYLFYANFWRECMAYSRTDDLTSGEWKYGNVIMNPTTTSNTNHMAVFDFKGKTYFVYHNGSLPGGNGYRRSACITELQFEEDGSIKPFEESTSGLGGTTTTISLKSGEQIAHAGVENPLSDEEYPITQMPIGINIGKTDADSQWVMCPGKEEPGKDSYVSIASENKSGLYITAKADGNVVLAQDTDASEQIAKEQTFKTVTGLASKKGISFESLASPGMYLTVQEGVLCLTEGGDKGNATFYLQ